LMLPTRWLSCVVNDVGPSVVTWGAGRLWALDGTLSRSMPNPGRGLVAITATGGSICSWRCLRCGAVCGLRKARAWQQGENRADNRPDASQLEPFPLRLYQSHLTAAETALSRVRISRFKQEFFPIYAGRIPIETSDRAAPRGTMPVARGSYILCAVGLWWDRRTLHNIRSATFQKI